MENVAEVVRDMEGMAREIEAQPDDRDWTPDEMSGMDDLRRAAARLGRAAEALIETFRGR